MSKNNEKNSCSYEKESSKPFVPPCDICDAKENEAWDEMHEQTQEPLRLAKYVKGKHAYEYNIKKREYPGQPIKNMFSFKRFH